MHLGHLVYHRPSTLSAAAELMLELGADASFLAGGTDLLVDLKQGRACARHVISLAGVSSLQGIEVAGEELRLGAMTTLTEIAESPLAQAHAPALVDTVRTMAAVQIRNRATLGGNFCAAVPCADTPPICIVSGARLRLMGAAGERDVPAADFFTGPRRTVLQPGEILAEVRVPVAKVGQGAAYHRFSRRRYTSLAVAGVAAWVRIEQDLVKEARLALTSVAPTPLLATKAAALLVGQRVDDALLARAGAQAGKEALPITDLRGTIEFRRELVEVLTRRALADAWRRARD